MKSTAPSLSMSRNDVRPRASAWADAFYALGMGFALLLLAALVAVQVETRIFGNKFPRERTWSSVRCFPIATLADDTVTVRASLHNPLDRKVTRYVITQTPAGSVLLLDQTADRIPLAPGTRLTLTYSLPVENRVYGWMLMWAGQVQRSYPLPSEAGSCGILVLPLRGIPGWLAGIVLLAGVLVLVTWDLARGAEGVRQALDYMTATAYIALFFFNWWALSAALWLFMAIATLWGVIKRVSGVHLTG